MYTGLGQQSVERASDDHQDADGDLVLDTGRHDRLGVRSEIYIVTLRCDTYSVFISTHGSLQH